MFSKTARYYDLLYGFKDYEKEARQIEDLILQEHPGAKTILDVACGSAEHASRLSGKFLVDGIDLEPEFVDIARAKNPAGKFSVADMRDFDLGRHYDVVQCLFSSIAYLTKPEEVVRALICFKRHLAPKGVILVEPWFSPDQWKTGSPHMLTVDRPDLKICRMNISGREGMISELRFHYLVADDRGVEHFTESHALALYTPEEMTGFFDLAGLAVLYDHEGITGRGLYVARPK